MKSPTILVAMSALLMACAQVSAQNQALQVVNTGTSGWVDVPAGSGLAAPNITVEAWITYDDTSITPPPSWVFPTILRKNLAANSEEYFLRVGAANTGNRSMHWKVLTPTGYVSAFWSFATGELATWTHIAATWDGSTARILINGVEVASALGSGGLVDNGGPLKIGAGDTAPNAAFELWNGAIEDLRIWSVARTAADINSSMFQPLTSAPALEASYTLDGDTLDWTGNGHDGTLSNPGTFVPSALPIQLFQLNSGTASLDINGASGGVFNPAFASNMIGMPNTLNASSSLVGSAFDIALTIPENLVTPGNGGLITGSAQIVNINLAAPSFQFLLGTLVTPYTSPLAIPFTPTVPLDASAQLIIINPAHPDGFSLSAGVDFTATP